MLRPWRRYLPIHGVEQDPRGRTETEEGRRRHRPVQKRSHFAISFLGVRPHHASSRSAPSRISPCRHRRLRLRLAIPAEPGAAKRRHHKTRVLAGVRRPPSGKFPDMSFGADVLIIEAKASGLDVISEIRRLYDQKSGMSSKLIRRLTRSHMRSECRDSPRLRTI
jgi:hypothetical protein